MEILTMDGVVSAFDFEQGLEVAYEENDHGYITADGFLSIDDNDFTFDVQISRDDIWLHWDFIKKSERAINYKDIYARFDCALVWRGDKHFVQKVTKLKDVVTDVRKFLQCIIVLDGLCLKGD